MYYVNEYAQRIISSNCLVIFGARVVAKEVAICLTGSPYNKRIEAFMVSEKEGNPDFLLHCPVITIDEGRQKYGEALIVVAVLEKYIDEIGQKLSDNGFNNVIFCGFESDLWSGLRGNYFRELCEEKFGHYKTLEESIIWGPVKDEGCVNIYSAKSHMDKILSDKRQYSWEKQIQVGAALTDQVICTIRDNVGDNISEKNKTYCEITALYWIWKNDKSDYAGLCHYRRHFEVTEDIIVHLKKSRIDVVLTIPILNFPSVRAMYEKDHLIEDWDIMLEVIKELCPEYLDTALEVQEGIYYYAYNMFIAKKDILDEYCKWLFPILFECEKRCKPREDKYQQRYIGFLAERLLSIFFIHNWSRWNIVHAKKNFLI